MDSESIRSLKSSGAPVASFDASDSGPHLLRCAYPGDPPTCAEDARFFAGLRAQCAHAFFDTAVPTEADVLEWIARGYRHDPTQINFIVADAQGERLAFFALTAIDTGQATAEFGRVMRAPGAPRGLMQAAMDALFGWARDALGLRTLRLEVFADNKRAIRFYGRVGFTTTGSHSRILQCDGARRSWQRGSGPGGKQVIEMEAKLADG